MMDGESFDDFTHITFMERSLAQRVKAFGTDNVETVKQWKKLNNEYNVVAMKLLQVEKFDTALDFLGRAKQLITADVKFGEADDRKKLLAITYNNMSCVYKRRGLLKTALGFAEKALKLETESAKADNPACTHLNLCAILSRLGRHQHALQHTQCALQLLRSDSYNGGVTPGLLDDGGDDPQSSILAVCYHNMAVEHEFLRQYNQAIQAYLKSVETAERELGPDSEITQAFAARAEEAQEKLEAKLARGAAAHSVPGKGAGRGNLSARGMSEYDRRLAGARVGGAARGPRTPRV